MRGRTVRIPPGIRWRSRRSRIADPRRPRRLRIARPYRKRRHGPDGSTAPRTAREARRTRTAHQPVHHRAAESGHTQCILVKSRPVLVCDVEYRFSLAVACGTHPFEGCATTRPPMRSRCLHSIQMQHRSYVAAVVGAGTLSWLRTRRLHPKCDLRCGRTDVSMLH